MTLRTRHRAVISTLALAALAATAGCSTKASDSGGTTTQTGSVKTGTGISGTTITLGVLTDLTGVFAALGADITNANSLYWEQANAADKVCGKYDVKLNIKDTGYVPQQGVQLFSGMSSEVLAMQQTIGSPINTALEPTYTADSIVNLPSAWARNLTKAPGNAVVGATYDIEMLNVLGYALEKGLIKEGDTLGHIYFTGEYGENGLAGSQAFAAKHGMKVVPAEIKATDQDMTAQVTQFKAAGVKAILLTTSPLQTASAAGVAAAAGLNVPIIGNNPVYSPALLKSPVAAALKEHLYAASPLNTFEAAPQLLADYKAKFPSVASPSLGVVFGYAMGKIMNEVLDSACKDGDLTREGVLKAKEALSDPDTGGLVVPLDYTKGPGESPSNYSYILRPADVPGGASLAQPKEFEGPDVEGFTPAS